MRPFLKRKYVYIYTHILYYIYTRIKETKNVSCTPNMLINDPPLDIQQLRGKWMEYLNKREICSLQICSPLELKAYLNWADFSLEAKKEF